LIFVSPIPATTVFLPGFVARIETGNAPENVFYPPAHVITPGVFKFPVAGLYLLSGSVTGARIFNCDHFVPFFDG